VSPDRIYHRRPEGRRFSAVRRDQGYTDVTNLHENGPDWIGSASKSGQVVNFDIDRSGNIKTK